MRIWCWLTRHAWDPKRVGSLECTRCGALWRL
jgi:hypothetical protein